MKEEEELNAAFDAFWKARWDEKDRLEKAFDKARAAFWAAFREEQRKRSEEKEFQIYLKVKAKLEREANESDQQRSAVCQPDSEHGGASGGIDPGPVPSGADLEPGVPLDEVRQAPPDGRGG